MCGSAIIHIAHPLDESFKSKFHFLFVPPNSTGVKVASHYCLKVAHSFLPKFWIFLTNMPSYNLVRTFVPGYGLESILKGQNLPVNTDFMKNLLKIYVHFS